MTFALVCQGKIMSRTHEERGSGLQPVAEGIVYEPSTSTRLHGSCDLSFSYLTSPAGPYSLLACLGLNCCLVSFPDSHSCLLLSHIMFACSIKALHGPYSYFFAIDETSTCQWPWLRNFYLCFSECGLASWLALKLFISFFFWNPLSGLTSIIID